MQDFPPIGALRVWGVSSLMNYRGALYTLANEEENTDMRKGKAICDALKDVRRKIAQANDINYSPSECQHEGDCAGTCAACDKELRFLENQLRLRRLAGKTVRVAGVSLGMVAVLGSCVSSETAGFVKTYHDTSMAVDSARQDSFTTQPAKTLMPSSEGEENPGFR